MIRLWGSIRFSSGGIRSFLVVLIEFIDLQQPNLT